MDPSHFDRLTGLLAAPRQTRRSALLALLGVALLGHDPDAIGPSSAAANGSGAGVIGGHDDRPDGKRHGRHRKNRRKNRRRRRHKNKNKGKKSCARIGQAPRKGKRCCRGLVEDNAGRCAEPTAACTGTAECELGEVCCDGACLSGVCCVGTECQPTGDACTGNQCFCGAGEPCAGETPDCCGTPGACTNTATDGDNCGECGNICQPQEVCIAGICEGTA